MKKIILSLLGACVIFVLSCYSQPAQPPGVTLADQAGDAAEEDTSEENVLPSELILLPLDAVLPVSSFNEVWAYLVKDREQALDINLPISDLVYFGAEVDSYGKLVDIPNFRNIAHFRGRKHFVAACNSRSLTHFVLKEGSPERRALVRDLLEAAKPYDGLQIDFENVPAKDGEVFLSFLKELRAGLGKKIFSVALPARNKTLSDDVYDYDKIKLLVDRILVMAYDEHWSTSPPGPIASMDWCNRVAKHALSTIGTEKLIMGLPFYGRSWGNITPNRAYLYSGIENIIKEQNINEILRKDGIPNFKYETLLSVTVFYEDEYSLSTRMEMYKKMGVNAVGFWRLGQETPAFWPQIRLE